MTLNSSPASTPVRPWLVVLLLLVGAAVVLAAWWAGQEAETRLQTEQTPGGPTATRLAGRVASAASAPVSAGHSTGVRRVPGAPASASAPALTAELTPLPWPFWEYRLKQPLPPRAPPLVPPPWRMIGATQSAGGWSLVVLRQGRTAPEFFKVGESLPGGYRVAAISQDDVTLESGGRSVVLSFIGTR